MEKEINNTTKKLYSEEEFKAGLQMILEDYFLQIRNSISDIKLADKTEYIKPIVDEWFELNRKIETNNQPLNEHIIRHSDEMITEEYVYKDNFKFQRTQKHGIWFVTYQNTLITFGQYRHDLEEWVDITYNC